MPTHPEKSQSQPKKAKRKTKSSRSQEDAEEHKVPVTVPSLESEAESDFDLGALGLEASRTLLHDMAKLGLGKNIALPQIIVCGGTSVGKSTLLTSISGIEFPTDHELCTRCPTELRMSTTQKGEKDRYSVHVECSGELKDREDAKELCKDVEFSSHSELGDAILDTSNKLKAIWDIKDPPANPKRIFTDRIVVDVKSRLVPNLTVIDLPGLVPSEKKLGCEIENLITGYMDNKRTVIMAVCPCNGKLENQAIIKLVNDSAKRKERTLGVFTKVDLALEEDKQTAANYLRGMSTQDESAKFGLGWHAVKLPGPSLTKSGEMDEATYFQQSEVKTIFANVDKSLGVEALKTNLSELLMKLIRDELPEVVSEVEAKRAKVEKELAEMGPAMVDPVMMRVRYQEIARNLCRLLQCALDGNYHEQDLIDFFQSEGKAHRKVRTLVRNAEEQFRDDILALPSVKFTGAPYEAGDEVEYHANEPEPKWQQGVIKSITGENLSIETSLEESKEPVLKTVPQQRCRHSRVKIKKMIRANRGQELPSFFSYPVFKMLVSEHVQDWKIPALELYEKAHRCFESTMIDALDLNIRKELNVLRSSLLSLLKSFIQKNYEELQKALHEELGSTGERSPFSLNRYYMEELKKIRNGGLEQALTALHQANNNNGTIKLHQLTPLLNSFGIGRVDFLDWEAVEMQFRLSAYLTAARERFIDNAKGLFERKFYGPVIRGVMSLLNEHEEKIVSLLEDSKLVQQRRKNLGDELQMYQEGRELLQNAMLNRSK